MQQVNDKKIIFNKTLGSLVKKVRNSNNMISISKLAREFDLDRGNLSKLEKGQNNCNVITLWKICEANRIKFSDFAKLLEKELGSNFKLINK